jgi:hypothetical protein
MMVWLLFLPAFWIVCGAVAYAATLASYLGDFESLESRWFFRRYAVEIGVQGPVGLLICALREGGFRHGFVWW